MMMMKLNRFLFLPSPSPDLWVAAALTTTTLVGAAKIAALILVGALFILSLIFLTGPTLTVLYWIAVSCGYLCLGLLGLLYVTCRWIFKALVSTCSCLADCSSSSFSGDRRHYRHWSLLPENIPESRTFTRTRYGTYTRTETRSVPPKNRPEYKNYNQPENRGETKPNSGEDVCTDRQKMKDNFEYRRAMEAEWAARQREVQRQAEEARRQANKRAENKSAKADEKRQKQRTHQHKPETSRRRKDETNSNQNEKYRDEIKEKLREVEKCADMPSLLRSLGVHISPQPSPNEVRSAYKKACKRFHPDRLANADLRHRVKGEEKFKLISAMKHKFPSL